jgi:DDE superfamily endonuclease
VLVANRIGKARRATRGRPAVLIAARRVARNYHRCYEAFPAAEARRLVERFEWHYTPKHGSWLNLAESELAVLSSQCLDRRIPDKQTLIEEIAAWEHDRNANHTKANWHFTTRGATPRTDGLLPSS